MIPVPTMKLDKAARHGLDLKDAATPPAAKIKFKFNQPAHVHQEYPKVRHHPTKGSLVVGSVEEDNQRTPAAEGWVNSPTEFPESPIKEPTVADKLELLETIGALIASEANDGESLTEALYRVIQERNEFAITAAKGTGADPRKKK
jgi:hypothetical protein